MHDEHGVSSHQPLPPYSVLSEMAALRADFRVICEKISAIASIVERQGEIERLLADQVFWRNTVVEEKNTMWKRIDDAHAWMNAHDNMASDRNQKLIDVLEMRITQVRNELSEQTTKVELVAKAAEKEAAATTNKSRGMGIALGICATIFGGLLTASILWLFNTTQHSSERLSVLEAQQHIANTKGTP